MTNIYKSPRNGEEMVKAVINGDGRNGEIPIFMYSDLCRFAKEHGALRLIKELYRRGTQVLILLQDPEKMMSGHWMSLSFFPKEKKIYFFSSYGGRPDEEKNRWIDVLARFISGQDMNALNDGLKDLYASGWEIHYNDYPFQKENDGSATCGIWTAAFLNSGMNPDEFARFVIGNKLTYRDFYEVFFRNE